MNYLVLVGVSLGFSSSMLLLFIASRLKGRRMKRTVKWHLDVDIDWLRWLIGFDIYRSLDNEPGFVAFNFGPVEITLEKITPIDG